MPSHKIITPQHRFCFLDKTLFFVFGIYSSGSIAQDYVAAADFFGESPVVLTASRMHKPLSDSPASVSVIDREMIRDSGARELADVFRMVPGFAVGYLFGHTPAVTYHGMGYEFNRQMQILVDGRSVFTPAWGGVAWSSLPLLLEDIERIEVIRGPNSVTYGSSAFLATINIITRHAAEDIGGAVSVTHDLDSNSEAKNVYMRYGNHIDDLDWRLTAGIESDDGYDEQIVFDDKEVHKLNLRTDFLTASNQFWTIQTGISQAELLNGKGKPSSPRRTRDIRNYYFNGNFELINDDFETTIKLTHTRFDADENYRDKFERTELAAFYSDVSQSQDSKRTDFEAFQIWRINPEATWNYGVSYREDEVISSFLFNNQQSHRMYTGNLSTSIEWKPSDNTIFDVGIQLEDTNWTDQEESYRLSFIQEFGQHHLRLVSSTARRNPILWELIGNITADIKAEANGQVVGMLPFWINHNDVIPEKIESSEIGLFSKMLNGVLSTDIKLFRYRISNQFIDEEEDAFFGLEPIEYGTIINGGSTTVDGIDASFNYSPSHDQFRMYGGLGLVDKKSSQPNEDAKDKFENSIPSYSAFVGGHYNIDRRSQISAALYALDEIAWIDRSSDFSDSYTKLDLRYQFTIDPKQDLTVELIGKNLNGEYMDYRDVNLHQTSYLIRVSGKF